MVLSKEEKEKIKMNRASQRIAYYEQESKKLKSAIVDVRILWDDLQSGMRLIFAPAGERQKIPQSRYMELYSNVYNYCCHVSDKPKLGFRGINTGCYKGKQLYDRVACFLRLHLRKINEARPTISGEAILHFYVEHFEDYTFSARVLNGMFSYLNRHWVPLQLQNDVSTLETYPLALLCWKNTLFQFLNENVTKSILDLIEKERNGDFINTSLVKTVITSYVELGAVERYLPKILFGSENIAIYVRHFEDYFLEDTKKFYIVESNNFLAENSVTDYMKNVEKRIQEETIRVQHFLHRSTLPKIIRICEEALIRPHLDKLNSQFGILLKENKTEDLRRLYNFLNRLNKSLIFLMSIDFQDWVTRLGLKALEELSPEVYNDGVQYFNTIFKVYNQYDGLLINSFQSNINFRKALDKSCDIFINFNCVTGPKNSNKSAALLAKYTDRLLKNSATRISKNFPEDYMDTHLNDFLSMFKFLADKDVFQRHYSNYLANRLTSKTTVNDEWEKLLVGKLKTTCGNEYTSKFERMFMDMTKSVSITEDFVQNENYKLPYEFEIAVLNSGSWIYTQCDEFVLPKELEMARDAFNKFYNNEGKCTGRKLHWLTNRSHGEIKYYPPCSKICYTFDASTYQMSILLMFNNTDSVIVNEMIESTKLKFYILVQVLDILIRCKLLFKTIDDKLPLTLDSSLSLFKKYNNKRLKPHINVPLKTESKKEVDKVNEDVIKSRQLVIEAAIVRIMKTRKTMQHNLLIAEVLRQLKSNFNSEVKMIKDCIEILIDMEYIKRTENEKDSYDYMA